MPRKKVALVLAIVSAVILAATAARAQIQRPRVELTPVADPATVKPGSVLRVSLKARLPKDVHVQSNKPRDPALIPTVLTLDAPAGVKVEEITYPAALDLEQKGRADKLAVYGPEFVIEVRLSLAKNASSGALVVPGQLRYQACNDTVCFPPARATAQWTLQVAR